MVNSANVRVTTGNSTADTILKWGFWIGIGLATYRLYRVVRYDDPFIQPSYRLPPAWEANPRFPHNKLSDEKKALACALYEPGEPVGPVAEAVGVSTTTIIRWMKEAGVYKAAPILQKRIKKGDFWPGYEELYTKALEKYEPGNGVLLIARELGVPPKTIVRWMKIAGVYKPAPFGRKRGKKVGDYGPRNKELYLRALELYKPGEPSAPIAREIGVDNATMIRWMQKAGVYKAAKSGRRLKRNTQESNDKFREVLTSHGINLPPEEYEITDAKYSMSRDDWYVLVENRGWYWYNPRNKEWVFLPWGPTQNPAKGDGKMLTICAWCKRVKVDGKWVYAQVDEDALTTHGMCKDCAAKMGFELDQIEKYEKLKKNPVLR